MSTYVVKHEACPRCVRNGRDRSGNNLARYNDNSAFCFACGYTLLSEAYKIERGIINEESEEEEVMTKEMITQEEAEQVKGYTSNKGKNLRGLTDETYKYYNVRTKYDEETGEPSAQYYLYTEGYKTCGYKVRELPKSFHIIGKVGSGSDLFGQWKHKNSNSKWVVICAGEIDAMSAHQMLTNYNKSRGSDYEPVPCLSPSTGESGCKRQLQNQYDYLSKFDKVILCFDNDDAGQKAVEKIVSILPKGKVYIMSLCMKDTNEMLVSGKEKEWISSFFKAQKYTPDGIITSANLMDKIIEQALTPKIPLPPFMHRLQDLMAGGIPLGVIVNLASSSGAGKSTFVDSMTYYWVFNSPHKIGVVTLESDSGQYGTKILSQHIHQKIDLISNTDEKMALLESREVQEKAKELWYNPDGSPRWYLIEERDGGIESLKALVMELIIACECKVIILDPLTDLLDGLSNDEQSVLMRWMKGTVKSHQVTFINVNHVRKNSGGQKANSTGAELHEEDIHGSSSILKSGACNLLFMRNKEAEDDVEKNTTKMKMSKCRWTGQTAYAGEYYYDNATHTLHDKLDYFSKPENGGGF